MNHKNIRNLLFTFGSFSLVFFCLIMLAWYAISGRSFRAVFFVLQGYTSHYLAMALASAGLNSNAISVQETSITAYQQSDENIASDELKALANDEYGHLASMLLKCGNRAAAITVVQKIETNLRKQINEDTPNKIRWRKALAEVLLYQARIFYNDNRKKDSIEKYNESIAIYQSLIDENTGNAATESQLSAARKELSQITSVHEGN